MKKVKDVCLILEVVTFILVIVVTLIALTVVPELTHLINFF